MLAEAIAVGNACHSTDCPTARAEILDGGVSGSSCPSTTLDAMTDAIARGLTDDEPARGCGPRRPRAPSA